MRYEIPSEITLAIRAYNSPGVQVTEQVSSSLAPLLADPQIVAIVGPAATPGSSGGPQSATERVFLTGTTPVTLKNTGITQSSVVVSNNITGEVINPGNYVLATSDPSSSVVGDEIMTIARVTPPATAPTVGVGTGGTLPAGIYRYAVSFTNAGGETAPGPTSSTVTLSAPGSVDLSNIPVGPTGTTARNLYRTLVTNGVDGTYTLQATITDNTSTSLASEGSATTSTLPKLGISSGDTVLVSYNYTDANFYSPTFFSDFDDIRDKYGPTFDANGAIASPLTLAARFAFMNGASEVVLVASASSSDQDISAAIQKLEDDDSITMVSVVSGSASTHSALAAHLTAMATIGKYRMGIVGRDGSATPITAKALRDAQAFNNEALMMISPATFLIDNPVTGRSQTIGSQYVAAAVLGMFAARDVHIPLTRKTLAGFSGVYDTRSGPTEAALDSAAGLLNIENRHGTLRIRHGVTTAATNVNTREASVVRAKYDMARRLRFALDGVVGLVAPAAEAPLIVQSQVVGVLDQMAVEGIISGYQDVKARLLSSDLTTVEVRFQYTPAYPINNILIVFTINTQTGELESQVGL
jgi:hypothetical protein